MLSSYDDQESREIHLQLVRLLGVPHTANLPESAPDYFYITMFEGLMKMILTTACCYLDFTAAPRAQAQSGQRLKAQARTSTANICTQPIMVVPNVARPLKRCTRNVVRCDLVCTPA
jgi:hypothetical protein